jgi:uncharacterized protein YidB (DUF937 family)
MPRDNLFANQASSQYDTSNNSASTFSSPDDLTVARAFTDVLLSGGEKYQVTSFANLGAHFVAANAGQQFLAWTHSPNVSSAPISNDQLRQALTPALVAEVSARASLPVERCLASLTSVVPFVVSQVVAPAELSQSARAFRFNLAELRKRLR